MNLTPVLGPWTFRILIVITAAVLGSCGSSPSVTNPPAEVAFRQTKRLSYNGVSVDAVIKKPAANDVDVMLTFHGTVVYDSLILQAANTALDNFDSLLVNDSSMMYVSVAYPEENLLLGDNVSHAEAALLWVRNKAAQELGIRVGKVFLAGHSQGGYVVTRLNTMHETDGVIASAPGPLNLVYRCGLEEDGKVASSSQCTALREAYGTTKENPEAYRERSLLRYTSGYKADIFFVQGMTDSPIQLASWPLFKQNIGACANCKQVKILELEGLGHPALFVSTEGKSEFNAFVGQRRAK